MLLGIFGVIFLPEEIATSRWFTDEEKDFRETTLHVGIQVLTSRSDLPTYSGTIRRGQQD